MTDDSFIPYGIGAVEFRGRGWAGQFTAPGIGVAYARDDAGVIRMFDSEQRARTAAFAARDDLLNRLHRENRARQASGNKVFCVHGSGKGRFLVGAR